MFNLADSSRNFKCQCNAGYIGNGSVCKEIFRHEEKFLLVNQGMATLRIPLEDSKLSTRKPIQIKPYQTAVGLDIDCLEGRVYWSDVSGRAIRSALFNGSNKIDFMKEGKKSTEILEILDKGNEHDKVTNRMFKYDPKNQNEIMLLEKISFYLSIILS